MDPGKYTNRPMDLTDLRLKSGEAPVEVGSLAHYLRRLSAPSQTVAGWEWDFSHQQYLEDHPI